MLLLQGVVYSHLVVNGEKSTHAFAFPETLNVKKKGTLLSIFWLVRENISTKTIAFA